MNPIHTSRKARLTGLLAAALAAACAGSSESGPALQPAISIADRTIPFGEVVQGTSASATVTVTNTGTADLAVGSVASADPLAAPFTVTADGCSRRSVAPGGSCTIALRFAPASAGTYLDELDVPSNDPTSPSVIVYVSGTGLGPRISVTDSAVPATDLAVPFGSLLVDATASETVTVSNEGRADLVLGTVAGANPLAAPFAVIADGCSGRTVAPGASCTFTLRFAPTVAGPASDTFDIPSNDVLSPSVGVSVSGTGIGPAIAVADSVPPADDLSIAFGGNVFGNGSQQTLTVSNAGGGSLAVGSVASANPLAAPFAVIADGCSGRSLSAGSSCTVTVQFAPASGGDFADAFDLPSSDPTSPSIAVRVSGTGLAPRIVVTDSAPPATDRIVAFGSALQGGTSAPQTVTVSNTGSAGLAVGTVAGADPLAAPFAVTADGCSGQAIAPGGSCTITLRFVPTQAGPFSDTFDIPSNDPASPSVGVSVSGTGLGPTIAVTDSVPPASDRSVPFGSVAAGSDSLQTVTVSNAGGGSLAVGSVAGANPLAAPFAVAADGCSGRSLPAGASCTVTVRFAPASGGDFADAFDIPSNDAASPSLTVNVSGTGLAPRIAVTDSTPPATDRLVAFGSVPQGGASALQTVTVSNAGNATLAVGTVAGADPLAAPFSVTADGCSGQAIAPGGSCTITLRFAPAQAGASSDTFDIPSNDPASPSVGVSVNGIGLGPTIAVADSVPPVDDLSIPFGGIVFGNGSQQTLTVSNAGGGSLAIGSIAGANPLAAPFAVAADGCSGRSLSAGASCIVTVDFAPAAGGDFTDSFDIPSSDAASPSVVVQVSGTGLAPSIGVTDFSPPPEDRLVVFATGRPGSNETEVVTVRNRGTANLVVGTVGSADPLAAPFTVIEDYCSGLAIVPGSGCSIRLRFLPMAPGTYVDTFSIPSNDPASPTVTVRVRGTAAAVSLARTGQAACYDASGTSIACAGTGQDGATQRGDAWPSPRFTVGTGAQADCVTDYLTGLTWAKAPDTTKRSWSGAMAYTDSLVLCGLGQWRLPNIIELASLVNYGAGVQSQWLATQGFANVQQGGYYWSSTTNARYPMNAWVVYMWQGGRYVSTYAKDVANQMYTLPVRGGGGGAVRLPATGWTRCWNDAGTEISCAATRQDGAIRAGTALPVPRFTTTESGKTAIDNLTGIEWSLDANPMKTRDPGFDADGTAGDGCVTWQHALDYVAKLNAEGYLGHADWRMPNLIEQVSMLDYSYTWPGFTAPFTNIDYSTWTSTSSASSPSSAWGIYFYDSSSSDNWVKTGPAVVWPIRGP